MSSGSWAASEQLLEFVAQELLQLLQLSPWRLGPFKLSFLSPNTTTTWTSRRSQQVLLDTTCVLFCDFFAHWFQVSFWVFLCGCNIMALPTRMFRIVVERLYFNNCRGSPKLPWKHGEEFAVTVSAVSSCPQPPTSQVACLLHFVMRDCLNKSKGMIPTYTRKVWSINIIRHIYDILCFTAVPFPCFEASSNDDKQQKVEDAPGSRICIYPPPTTEHEEIPNFFFISEAQCWDVCWFSVQYVWISIHTLLRHFPPNRISYIYWSYVDDLLVFTLSVYSCGFYEISS